MDYSFVWIIKRLPLDICVVRFPDSDVYNAFSFSAIVKGVVCKKNVAHRRMPSKIHKPRIFILGGALEYQRVTNHLSSFDTLLQQVLVCAYFSAFLVFLC